jgi:Na+/proline symporter
MLRSTADDKYLLIVWWISNFTRIDMLFDGIVEAVHLHHTELQRQWIRILVRRWWINSTRGLASIQQCCEHYSIPVVIMDDTMSMTAIFDHVK